jgi:hypothetical protein
VQVIRWSRPEEDVIIRNACFARVLRQLAADSGRLSAESLSKIRGYLGDSILTEDYLAGHPIVREWATAAFGAL